MCINSNPTIGVVISFANYVFSDACFGRPDQSCEILN
jgi:hypothetical protein